ncbi:hypothetical protein, partial [Micromonospora sp. MP36]|uniref:hypothetical protein n=1 Tax=Micromonospora sp. MP36 TaxID=2604468 RepID=UPI001CA35C34
SDVRDALRRRPLLQIHPITIAHKRTLETTESRAVVDPTGDITLTDRGWPWERTLRPVVLALAGLALLAGGLVVQRRWARRPAQMDAHRAPAAA